MRKWYLLAVAIVLFFAVLPLVGGCAAMKWLAAPQSHTVTNPDGTVTVVPGAAPVDTIVDTAVPYVNLLPYGGLIAAALEIARRVIKTRQDNTFKTALVGVIQEARKDPVVCTAVAEAIDPVLAKLHLTREEYDAAVKAVKEAAEIASIAPACPEKPATA